jgi:pimeloyl-ACP methyl ester carboxylesterase
VSYGTFLGATYANLFPDKVRALVLDGNVAPAAWTGTDDPAFSVSMRIGTDAAAARTLDAMLTLCGTVDSKRCAFSAGSPAATTQKFDALLTRLRRGPITIPGHAPLSYPQLLDRLSNGLDIVQQTPGIAGWPGAMQGLQLLWTSRNGSATRPAAAGPAPASPYPGPEQGLSVVCGDAPSPPPAAFPWLARIAAHGGGPISEVAVWGDEPCSTWPVRAAAGYRGPWNKPTKPILVIGNTIDPSTPYPNSPRMVEQLANGHLLTVAGYGHTELLNPSRCARQAITAYILNGTLPAAGLVCPQDTTPFPNHR